MCTKTVTKILHKSCIVPPDTPPVVPPPEPGNCQLLYTNADIIPDMPLWLSQLDWQYLVKERLKGVPFKTLFDENEDVSVSYWAFWKGLSRTIDLVVKKEPKTTMRLNHKPGEKLFADYTDGIEIYDVEKNEVKKTQLFVATLPFSSKVFAEFTFNQKIGSFISSYENTWQFFGGVTEYSVTDNLKSAVTKADLYDPDKNKTFCAYANHAGFALLPARPRRPKDKANVECHVGVLQRSFYPKIRNHTFTSISELNEMLWDHIDELNKSIMKDHGVSRNDRFEVEQKFLKPLPKEKFEISEIKEATVHPDCHIQFERSFYSVPYRYVGKKVKVIATFSKVTIHDIDTLDSIAIHSKSQRNGTRKTNDLHWPEAKLEHCNFTIDYALQAAEKIGVNTLKMLEYLFSLPYPLQYLRRVQGWIRNVSHEKYRKESMEYAALQAMQFKRYQSKYVNSCAEFFENGGAKIAPSASAPLRDSNLIFIQKVGSI